MSTFIYVQAVDCGLAPCVSNGTWSLALCKPAIRRKATEGNVIIAVTPSKDGHRLSSWARIDERISTNKFYQRYPARRPDNIYQRVEDGKFIRHKGVRHPLHSSSDDLKHDLGKDGKSAFVLISNDFYAFGEAALQLDEWTEGRKHLRAVVDKLGRENRRYFEQEVEKDLNDLAKFLKSKHKGKHNKKFRPREPKLDLPCKSPKGEKGHAICNPRKVKQ